MKEKLKKIADTASNVGRNVTALSFLVSATTVATACDVVSTVATVGKGLVAGGFVLLAKKIASDEVKEVIDEKIIKRKNNGQKDQG